MRPGLKMNPGMMPTLASPAVMTPGQFGPTKVHPGRVSRCALTFTISATGMPSVMQMITLIPASAASKIASAAKAGGTNKMLVSAPACCTASSTVLNTGRSRWLCPPFPGVTPPTTLVPYSIIWLAWNVPSEPVNPWTMMRESLLTRTLMRSGSRSSGNGTLSCGRKSNAVQGSFGKGQGLICPHACTPP